MMMPPTLQQVGRTHVRWQGRKLVYFGGCDYFRLASHPTILKAVRDGLKRYGLNVSASRMTTGNHELYGRLERDLADFFDVECAVLAGNGSAPNLMVAQALAGRFSHVLIDDRSHGCLADAAELMDCPVVKFRHRDADSLTGIIRRLGDITPLVMTDGMFSHDGSVAPLKEYLAVLPRRAMLLVDDAHGAGVLGRTGRGTLEHAGVPRARIIQTITLSKAFGIYGGAVLGTKTLRDAILARSRTFVGSTPLPLPLACAAIQSVRLLKGGKSLRARLLRNTYQVKEALRRNANVRWTFAVQGLDAPGPIIALVPVRTANAARLTRRLLGAGIHPSFIKYPGGPRGGQFRLMISSEHSMSQLDALLVALA